MLLPEKLIMEKKYLECAKVAGTHVVKGAMRLLSLCDSAEVLASLPRMYVRSGGDHKELKVTHSFVQKSMAVVSFEQIDSLEKAIQMKNAVLYADRDDIPRPEGSFFISDLIGLDIRDADTDELYGTLKEVISPAGRDIYVVKSETGEFMIPCVPEFVIGILPDEGKITVRLIEGMMG